MRVRKGTGIGRWDQFSGPNLDDFRWQGKKMEVDIATNMEIKTSIQEFLILEHDTEPLVMGGQLNS